MAFFLLGEKLRDAVNVCLKQLNDYQLALVLCRLQEGSFYIEFTRQDIFKNFVDLINR